MEKKDIFLFNDGHLSNRIAIIGGTGRGKTFIAVKILKDKQLLNGVFDEITLVHPELIAEEENKHWATLNIDHIHTEFNHELIEQIGEDARQKFLKDRKYKSCLILDDCVNSQDFNNKKKTPLKLLFTNSRKYGLSIIILSQRIVLIPPALHSQFSYVILFNTNYMKERKSIDDSYAFRDKKKWNELWEFVFTEPHDFLLVDVDREIYYKNFDRLTIKH